MDFELKLVEGGKIGIIVTHVKITNEVFSAMQDHINQFKEKHNIELLIYDVRDCPMDIPAFEQYDIVYNSSNQGVYKPSRKIALLVNKEDRSYDFIETLYLNSGRSVKRLDDYDEAVKWLIKN
jgi:hypothetical protein